MHRLSKSGILVLLVIFAMHASGSGGHDTIIQTLRESLSSSSDTALVMDISSGRVLAEAGDIEVSSAPGSLLKPLLLLYALEHGVLQPSARIWCRRTLRVRGKDLGCTHPMSGSPLTPEQALAYSCNSAFAQLARRLGPRGVAAALAEFSIHANGVLAASNEDLPLYALGLHGTKMTAMQVAEMERQLALRLAGKSADVRLQPVRAGLEASVIYGAASNARSAGVALAGKTGTASDAGEPWTHGWFAGYLPAASPRWVIVFRVQHGSGADAAHLAHVFVSRYGRFS